jgi:uncharacterized protein YjiS (DUF1127 family)
MTARLLAVPTHSPARTTFPRRFRVVLRSAWSCYERWLQRQQLGELDDRLLDDIGITRDAARREAGKHFWR